MSKTPRVEWTREHLLLALNLYCKLPFGSFGARNRVIIEVAEKMGRTPGSLAMKLGNLASLDPKRHQTGLVNVSTKDRLIWAEFQKNPDIVAVLGESSLHDLFTNDDNAELDFLNRDKVNLEASADAAAGNDVGTASITAEELRKQRRGYQFFRQSILNIYDVQCCITGLDMPRLLVARHIRPASKFPQERYNPNNGLCLSGLHAPAFDGGLFTLDEQLRVVLSPRLKKDAQKHPVLAENFLNYEGRAIRQPRILTGPSAEGLAWHRENVFKG